MAGDNWLSEFAERAKYPAKVKDEVPPVSEIVKIAALLLVGRDITPQNIISAPNQAIALWRQSEMAWDIEIERVAQNERDYDTARSKSKIPTPKKYPVSLDEFLRLIMPKKRPEDRMKLYREYLRLSIRVQNQYLPTGTAIPFETVPIPSDDEVSKLIEMLRARQFNEEQYKNYAGWFLNTSYLKSVEAENRNKRAKAGAAALKRKREQDAQTKEN